MATWGGIKCVKDFGCHKAIIEGDSKIIIDIMKEEVAI